MLVSINHCICRNVLIMNSMYVSVQLVTLAQYGTDISKEQAGS